MAVLFMILASIILVVNSYHDKMMVDYVNQNPFEATYIINLLTFFFVLIIIGIKKCTTKRYNDNENASNYQLEGETPLEDKAGRTPSLKSVTYRLS